MSEFKIAEWLGAGQGIEDKRKIYDIYQEMYRKLDMVQDFAKRLSIVTDALETVFCLINNEDVKQEKKYHKRVKRKKRWKKNKRR